MTGSAPTSFSQPDLCCFARSPASPGSGRHCSAGATAAVAPRYETVRRNSRPAQSCSVHTWLVPPCVNSFVLLYHLVVTVRVTADRAFAIEALQVWYAVTYIGVRARVQQVRHDSRGRGQNR